MVSPRAAPLLSISSSCARRTSLFKSAASSLSLLLLYTFDGTAGSLDRPSGRVVFVFIWCMEPRWRFLSFLSYEIVSRRLDILILTQTLSLQLLHLNIKSF